MLKSLLWPFGVILVLESVVFVRESAFNRVGDGVVCGSNGDDKLR